MSGLIAIVSHDRDAPVRDDEIRSLAGRYQALRGRHDAAYANAGDWARVVRFGRIGPVNDRGSWAVSCGALHTEWALETTPLEDVEGQFAAIRYRQDSDIIEAFTDPFGMQQFYRADHAGRTYLSTSATLLAGHLAAPADETGVKLFVRTSKQVGPLTLWQGIERVEPATVLTFRRDRIDERVYWQPAVDETVRRLPLDRAIEYVAEVALATVERFYGPHGLMWADLTGGYDSRLVIALLTRAGLPFRANTAGEAETVDVRLARLVADAGRLDWQHERLPSPWQLDRQLLDQAVGWGDGMLDVLLLAEILWRQVQRRRVSPVVVNGGGGEHLGPAPWLQEFARAGRSRQVNFDNWMRMRMLPPAGELEVIRRDRRKEIEDLSCEYFLDLFRRRAAVHKGELNTTQLDAMYVYRARAHFGAFRSAYEAQVRTEIPFYFKHVFSAGFSSNYRWRNGHRLHRGVTERLHPAISNVETERGGPAQRMRPSNVHRFLPYYGRLAHKAVRKVRGVPAGADALPASQAAAYAAIVRELAAEGVFRYEEMRTGALFDRVALERMVDAVATPDFSDWTLLARIATLELTLRNTSAGL